MEPGHICVSHAKQLLKEWEGPSCTLHSDGLKIWNANSDLTLFRPQAPNGVAQQDPFKFATAL